MIPAAKDRFCVHYAAAVAAARICATKARNRVPRLGILALTIDPIPAAPRPNSSFGFETGAEQAPGRGIELVFQTV